MIEYLNPITIIIDLLMTCNTLYVIILISIAMHFVFLQLIRWDQNFELLSVFVYPSIVLSNPLPKSKVDRIYYVN